MVNAGDSVGLKFFDFGRKYGSAAAAKDAYVARSALLEQVVHEREVLHVATLVRRHRDGVGVLLDGGFDHLFCAAVVA